MPLPFVVKAGLALLAIEALQRGSTTAGPGAGASNPFPSSAFRGSPSPGLVAETEMVVWPTDPPQVDTLGDLIARYNAPGTPSAARGGAATVLGYLASRRSRPLSLPMYATDDEVNHLSTVWDGWSAWAAIWSAVQLEGEATTLVISAAVPGAAPVVGGAEAANVTLNKLFS